MIVWRGWGHLTIVVATVVGCCVYGIAQGALHRVGLTGWREAAAPFGLMAAAGTNWALGRRLSRQPGRELIDVATGETTILRREHTLYGINVERWSIVMAFAALSIAVELLVKG